MQQAAPVVRVNEATNTTSPRKNRISSKNMPNTLPDGEQTVRHYLQSQEMKLRKVSYINTYSFIKQFFFRLIRNKKKKNEQIFCIYILIVTYCILHVLLTRIFI